MPGSEICTVCIDNCKKCSAATTCDLCEWGYKLDGGQCKELCQNGEYIDPRITGNTGDNCKKCPIDFNCEKCGFDHYNQAPVCLTCLEGMILVPDGRCARNCQEAGYNLMVDVFGNEKCVRECPAGYGPDRLSFNLCRDCSVRQPSCSKCFFRFEDGVQVCSECRNNRYLKTELDEMKTPLTSCVTENECNDDPLYAP